MAKCLYGSLFDWIVMHLNHALLAKRDTDKNHRGYSIGVLDIFGFEDFGHMNRYLALWPRSFAFLHRFSAVSPASNSSASTTRTSTCRTISTSTCSSTSRRSTSARASTG